jgi:nucleotide-binding universal stress UspA family protein
MPPHQAKERAMINAREIPLDDIVHHFVAKARPANTVALPAAAPTIERPDDEPSTTVIAGATWRSRTSLRPKRIVVGMDFSPAAESARRLALAMALAADALVDLVFVFDAFTENFVRKNPAVDGRDDTLLAEIDQALLRRQRMAQAQGIRCVHTCLVGAPGIELGIHATITRTELIVLGDADEQPGRFGWTWGRRAAQQIRNSSHWRGTVLLRRAL